MGDNVIEFWDTQLQLERRNWSRGSDVGRQIRRQGQFVALQEMHNRRDKKEARSK